MRKLGRYVGAVVVTVLLLWLCMICLGMSMTLLLRFGDLFKVTDLGFYHQSMLLGGGVFMLLVWGVFNCALWAATAKCLAELWCAVKAGRWPRRDGDAEN